MARSMMVYAGVDDALWSEAVHTAVYIRNLSIRKVLKDKTPYEIWCGRKPNVGHFRIFGSPAVALDKTQSRKFSEKGKEYIFVGYSLTAKAYRLYDDELKRVVEKRDVIFCENNFQNTDVTDAVDFYGFSNDDSNSDDNVLNCNEETAIEFQSDDDAQYESSSEYWFSRF